MNGIQVIDLKLDGYSKIYTGLGLSELYINFIEMPHNIYLFAGDSGSGKTSILRSIHPFAFNSAAGDETANSNLIMANRGGIKEIRYQLNGAFYTCTHIYTRKSDDTISVKSYFKKNDEELNDSGLVTTFKELVRQYFYIDESFLTLFSLGSTIDGFVNFTAGERKKFAVKIFSELNIYMEFYKNSSARVKELKTILVNVTDKLEKYRSYNTEDLTNEIAQYKKKQSVKSTELDTILQRKGSLKERMSANEESYRTYKETRDAVTELFQQITTLADKRKTTEDLVILENRRDTITEQINQLDIRITSLELNIESELNLKESKMAQQKSLTQNIDQFINHTNITELTQLLANIDAELSLMSDIIVDPYTDYATMKDRLIRANIYLQELQGLCADLFYNADSAEFVLTAFEEFKKNRDIINPLISKHESLMAELNTYKLANDIKEDIKFKPITHKCDNPNCPYEKFYKQCYDIFQSHKAEENHILSEQYQKIEVVKQSIELQSTFLRLYKFIETNDILLTLPESIFNINTFVISYMSHPSNQIYDVDLLGRTISSLEDIQRKQQLLETKQTTTYQLKSIDSTTAMIDSMKTELTTVNQAINDIDTAVQYHRVDLEYNQSEKQKHINTLKEINTELELEKQLVELRRTLKNTQTNLSGMETKMEEYAALERELEKLTETETIVRSELEEIDSIIQTKTYIKNAIHELSEEQQFLSQSYDEAILIRDAVSPSKGIPVEFIEDYIKNQMIDSVNDLMSIAYPDIKLIKSEVRIDDKEFTIAYRKAGMLIGDISEASDGERSMMELAFSLVIIQIVSKVYNIMLLDEMDAALDKYGRAQYIGIIEQYMKQYDVKQTFMISHNAMSDMYNCNVLRTTEGVDITTDHQLVIPLYKTI